MKPLKFISFILFFLSGVVYAEHKTESPIYDLNPDASLGVLHPDSDKSKLIRSWGKISYTLETSDLDPATPHTVWLVAFNYPQYCLTTPCSVVDFPFVPGHDPRAKATFVNAGGGLSDVDGTGTYTGKVYKARNGINGSEVVMGPGLLNPMHADIRFVMRAHGIPGNFEDLLDALNTYRGACNENNGAVPACRDYQISIHLP